VSVVLTGDWARWEKLVDGPNFQRRLAKVMPVAFRRIGLLLVGNMRKAIRSGNYAPNAPLTKLTKKSSKPLVDRGDLMRALTFDSQHNPTAGTYSVWVGLSRKARDKDGNEVANIGAALHEGFSVLVTPEIRRAVFAKMNERNKGAKVQPTGAAAKAVWIIPPRPFVTQPVEASKNAVLLILNDAYKTALQGLL